MNNDCETYLDYTQNQSVNEIRLIGAREAAKILGVNANTVYNLWKKGQLDYWRIHKTKKTNLEAIKAFLVRYKNMELEE